MTTQAKSTTYRIPARELRKTGYSSGLGGLGPAGVRAHVCGMVHIDMRSLPPAGQEERRRQVIGLRERGLTYAEIGAQVGLTENGAFDICKRFRQRGIAGLQTGPRGPAPGTGRFLTVAQETEIRGLICGGTPDDYGLPFALWSRAAVTALVEQHCGVRLAVRTTGTYLARWGFTPQKPLRRAYEQDPKEVGRWLKEEYRPSSPRHDGRRAGFSGVMRPACAPMTYAAAATPRAARGRWCVPATGAPTSA
jgi:transposase